MKAENSGVGGGKSRGVSGVKAWSAESHRADIFSKDGDDGGAAGLGEADPRALLDMRRHRIVALKAAIAELENRGE